MTKFRAFALTMIMLCITSIGCEPPLEEMGKVTGTVTVDGNPVSGASVSFRPEGGTTTSYAAGETDAQGHFSLMCSNGQEGAVVGDYSITITPGIVAGVSGSSEDGSSVTGAVVNIPEKYTTIGVSDLTATVKSGDNNVTLELESE